LAVRIRLTRIGATKRPAYRVIAIDKRRSRDGRALEILGFYDPLTEPATVNIDTERINAWIGKGAQPSETVVKLMAQAARPAPTATEEKPKRATRTTKPRASTKSARTDTPKATATAEAPANDEAPVADEAPAAADAQVADEAPAAGEAAAPEKADA
jgi:small subunit ribosomal protein S16